MQKVSVIIPSYNIEGTIREVVERCPEEYEVVVVEDGSKDSTREVAESTRAKVLVHDENMGKGQAMMTGVAGAGGDIIVFIDGDLQHLPEDIPRLVERITDGSYDLVIGSRRMENTKGMPLLRKISNSVSTAFVRFFLGLRINDTQSGFRAIRKESLGRMGLRAKRFDIETEMLARAVKLKLRIGEVPIKIVYQEGSAFHFSFGDIFNFLKTVIFR